MEVYSIKTQNRGMRQVRIQVSGGKTNWSQINAWVSKVLSEYVLLTWALPCQTLKASDPWKITKPFPRYGPSFSWDFECKSGSQQCVLKHRTAAFSSSLGCLQPETAHIQRLPTELVDSLSVLYIKKHSDVLGCRDSSPHLTPSFLYMCWCVCPFFIPLPPLMREDFSM